MKKLSSQIKKMLPQIKKMLPLKRIYIYNNNKKFICYHKKYKVIKFIKAKIYNI